MPRIIEIRHQYILMTHRGQYPTPQQRALITGSELVCDAAIRRAYRDPGSVQPSTLARIMRAAQTLGITPPPQPAAMARTASQVA
jgi:hypothetical protein